ncbi:ISAs1 family transposase [Leptolyngbya sp. FACHB-711]|uniref:ISAs1 family transposase n=1 Tax=Leptolyngbya sp. FACHB-711 TaxID=2692813 RepID=UPI001685EC5C|nr:ISAs1 family transposase [Leptolyngbya sp. FACHB-711]MBD2027542.1 ISAs1 family transposase [Leptolyngbya sp. FACHB-711]
MRLTAKKTVKTIIEQGNDYVITVKANQKLLYQQVCAITQDCGPVSVYIQSDKTHHRLTHRTVEVFDCLAGIAQDWLGLRRLVRVQRQGMRKGKPCTQLSYYITSLATTARQFAERIRGHWGIENRLHWVKDVVLGEDECPLKLAYAPENWGLIRTWAINVFRLNGEPSITKAQRRVANDIEALFLLLQ